MTASDVFPGMLPVARVSPLYVGGIPIDALNDALTDQADNLGAQKNVGEARFWASTSRFATDNTRDVFEISLSSPQLINFVNFEVARFPHRVWIQALDPATNLWVDVKDSGSRPAVVTTSDSLPAQVTPLVVNQGAPHPQHYGAGHWVVHSIETKPITATKVRLVMVRITNGQPPLDAFGNEIAYSLGVRNFSLGYRVHTRDDVPRTVRHPTIPREFVPFGTSTDSLGSTLQFSVRENRASDLLLGRGWKSEPQPISDAVVNLYVDCRDALGNSQVVDRFYIDPLTVGPQLNLYYSNDEPPFSTAAASDEALTYPNIIATGTGIQSDNDGLLFSLTDLGAIDISNSAMHLDPNESWWMGLEFQPQFDSNDPSTHTLLDAGTARLDVTMGSFGFTIGFTTVTLLQTFQTNESIALIIGFDGTNKFIAINQRSNIAVSYGSGEVFAPIPAIRLGSRKDVLSSGAIRFQGLVVKQEPIVDPLDLAAAFALDPESFILRTVYSKDDKGGSDNALVRYHPTFHTPGITSINPYGFLGGEPDRYSSVTWTPVSRDFRLRKGFLHFDPIRAKFFKFEMTSLVAEPYETLGPVVRQVKVFPPTLRPGASPLVHSTASNNGPAVDVHTTTAASSINFADEQRGPFLDASLTRPYSPTEGTYSPDPVVAERLRQISLYYHVLPWQHDLKQAPRFPTKSTHSYSVLEVEHVNRVAFFAGLNALRMYRLDYTAAHDTEQYLELFHDATNLATSNWVLGDSEISTATSASSTFSQATSKIFSSSRKVRGIQFATQQTPAFQLLIDPDFLDPSLILWDTYGDVSRLEISDDLSSEIGSTVLIQRGLQDNFWNDIEARYANWDAIEQSNPTPLRPNWNDMEVALNQFNYGGLVGAQPVTPTPSGRIYVAARVYAQETLTQPLLLQLVSPDGKVLAESSILPQGGQVTEWFTGYTIGEGGTISSLTWTAMEAIGTWDQVQAQGSWDNAAQVIGILTGPVLPRLFQQGSTTDKWFVDNVSIYNDPIVWEFSDDGGATFYPVYDIRNDPQGVFIFPDSDNMTPSVGRGTQLVYRVSGYDDGASVSAITIRPWYTDEGMGRPFTDTVQFKGPNVTASDHFSAVADDPRFKMWHKSIPEDWWFRFRRWLLLPSPQAAPKKITTLPEVIPTINEGAPVTTGTFLSDSFYGEGL